MNEQSKKKLISLISRFRPQELPDIIDETFGDVKWDSVKTAGITQNINILKSRNLASLCIKAYQNSKPSTQDVQSAVWYLMFYDILYHTNVNWLCAILLNECEPFPTDLDSLHQRILRAYRSEARNTDIVLKLHNDIVWVMLIEKIITKKGMKSGKPFYAAFNVHLKKQYVFYTPKINDDSNGPDHLLLLGKALGFDSYKNINFKGRDVRTMFEMIKRHEKPSNEIVLYQPKRYQLEGNVLDFTQGRERMQYASDILPSGCTNLSEFTVHSKNEWRGGFPLSDPCMITTQLMIKVKGRNHSVEDALRALITQNLVTMPVPEYIRKLPSLDRNLFKMRLDSHHDQEEEDESYFSE